MFVALLLSRLPRAARWALGVLAVLVLTSVASTPRDAQAVPPLPVGGLVDVGVDLVTGGVGSAAVEGFGALLGKLFSWSAEIINRRLLTWLVSVPDYAITPRSNVSGEAASNLAELASTTSVMAFAALGAVGTVAGLRYWAAGLSGSGGFQALEGLGRIVAAALLVVAWPWLFGRSADLANAAARGLLGSGTVLDDTSRLLGVAFASSVSLNFLAIVIAIAAGLLFLALLMCKIIVSASTALIFVGMPLALVLWVIPELAWIAAATMRAFAVVLAIPLVWALCFATFAALGMDALALKGAGSVADALIMPLVALALLWLTVSLPRTLARMALLGGLGSGGFTSRTASYVTARRTDAAIAQGVPGSLGGRSASASDAGSTSGPAHGAGASGQLRGGAAAAGVAAATAAAGPAGAAVGAKAGAAVQAGGGATAGTAAGGAGAPRPARLASSGPASPAASPASVTPANTPAPDAGLRAPSWQEIRERVPAEAERAAGRRESTTRADVAAAMRDLSPETQLTLQRLAEAKKGRIGGEMVHQAARADIGERERDAFRTLAAASPQIRTQGIGDFTADAGASNATTPPDTAGQPAPHTGSGPMGAPAPGEPPSQPAPGSAGQAGPNDDSARAS